MTYATEHIAPTLRSARETQGLSQRALSAMAGVPQSHISKIENGTVDLRVSSLVELARVLDLELILVPRKAVSAVHAVARSRAESVPTAVESSRQTLNELKRLQQSVARTAQIHPALPELAEILRLVRELKHFPISRHYLDAVLNVAAAVKVFHEKPFSLNALRDSLAQLRNLRNALAHTLPTSHDTETVHPAYSLDEDDDD